MSEQLEELLKLEHAGWSALCDGTAHFFYAKLLPENGRMILADGTVMDRSVVATSLDGGEPWASYSIDDLVHHELGDDGGALCYTATATAADRSLRASVTSVYQRSGESWKLVLHQQTPLA